MRAASAILPLLAAACASVQSTQAPAPDKTAILAVIDSFFLALAAGDADAIDSLAGERTVTVAIRPEDDEAPRYGSLAELAKRFREGAATPVVEPYWRPTVLQRKDLAVVWAPYEVSAGGKLIHCGIDSFQLSRRAGGWRIDAVSYTMEPGACDELRPSDRSELRPNFTTENDQ